MRVAYQGEPGAYSERAVKSLFPDAEPMPCETVRLVFQEHALPLGTLEWQGERVDPRAIKRTMLLTVEGERDDICAVGQTAAAHDLCTGQRPYLKRHHMQPGVGHYGVFSGRKWETQIYPIVRNAILASG